MNKGITYFGIDISPFVFDVTDSDGNYYQFNNNAFGFKKFTKLLDSNSHCVMEAIGYYHYKLAYHLLESGIKVSVENPLALKRFIQMKLSKIKTDQSDSKGICEYAQKVGLKLWKGNTKNDIECLQITRALTVFQSKAAC
jgi:transposase